MKDFSKKIHSERIPGRSDMVIGAVRVSHHVYYTV